ncbi:MAG: integrin [Hydrogenophaga sp.]|uniref:integrin n=1 Tax=Hydrogenophaga sp. TaxID=1904254 RepID=UPI0016A64674|nr:integrin [Hydrogenophaga sp.]NIM43124.1 integrin [Hydrogenophaga sp.]NIN28192.1 integrin [Hydrogenophaga sp.]NIN30630.1 integrin [Hydrogenophaga sp.]NIN57327.1 integrin [Hydrogenophaga sp.]NIO51546.1 integrin [Hydrogenophaga sp.]
MATPPTPVLARLALLVLAGSLAACGGGSDSAPSAASVTLPSASGPQAPVLTLTPMVAKTFRFTWSDVAGETNYRLLEDPDGTSGYTLLATLPANTTAHDHGLFLPARVNARYILQACRAGTCLDSAPVSVSGQLVAAIGFLKADVSTADDRFGYSVALSSDGSTLAVGAPGESSAFSGIAAQEPASANDQVNSGAVYVHVRQGQRWQLQAFLKSPANALHDSFGKSLALSATGDTLAVGARAGNTGRVHLFARASGTWSERQQLVASNAAPGRSFGQSLALSAAGTVLAVGDPMESAGALRNNGAVYLFVDDGTLWSERALLRASAPEDQAFFGSKVSLSGAGDTLAVGAPESSSTTPYGGSAYVFTGSGANWTQQVELKAPHDLAELSFGASVALSSDGTTLAIGARGDDSGVVGDPLDGSASLSGAVHVFGRDGMNWLHQAYLKAAHPGMDDQFGRAVSLSGDGNTLVVGAPYERSTADGLGGDQANDGSSEVGAAYVFRRQGLTWRQRAYVKAPNSGPGDTFGMDLALSADGQTLAVGAYGESSSASGWNAAHDSNNDEAGSGAVYLY